MLFQFALSTSPVLLQAVFFLAYSQSLCSASTLQQRDLDRATEPRLLPRELLAGVLGQSHQFRHFFFCSELSEEPCQPLL